jgi:hypothetical protein
MDEAANITALAEELGVERKLRIYGVTSSKLGRQGAASGRATSNAGRNGAARCNSAIVITIT